MRRFALVSLLSLVFSVRPLLADTIISGGPADSHASVDSAILGQGTTLGQSFEAIGTTLDDVTLTLSGTTSYNGTFNFQFYVYQWQYLDSETGTITGNALYTSALYELGATLSSTALDFANLDIPVSIGGNYMLLVSTVGDGGAGEGTFLLSSYGYGGYPKSDFYAGGGVFMANNGGTPGCITGITSASQLENADCWAGAAFTGENMDFTADFSGVPSPTPEPGPLVLLGTGAITLLSQRKRLSRKN